VGSALGVLVRLAFHDAAGGGGTCGATSPGPNGCIDPSSPANAGLASVVVVFQLIFANLWMRWFASGPLEWIWRSLTYCRMQPFRRRALAAAD
jgi:hypothetical protein